MQHLCGPPTLFPAGDLKPPLTTFWQLMCCAIQLWWLREWTLWGLQRELDGVLWLIALLLIQLHYFYFWSYLILSMKSLVWFHFIILVFCHSQGNSLSWVTLTMTKKAINKMTWKGVELPTSWMVVDQCKHRQRAELSNWSENPIKFSL